MKTNLHGLYQTNEIYESEGVWFIAGSNVKFKVKRFGGTTSAKIRKLTALYHKPYARLIDLGTFPEEKEREIYVRIFVESCMISWEGVKDEANKEIPYSKDAAMELFKELPEMFEVLNAYASDSNNYKEASELGNS